jgi:antitoxin ChpS
LKYNKTETGAMHTTKLRKVGGSVMVVVPPVVLDQLQLKAGATVELVVEGEHLIVKPKPKPRYTMDELLAKCDFSQPVPQEVSDEDRIWLNLPPVGREL